MTLSQFLIEGGCRGSSACFRGVPLPYGWIDLPETLDMTFMTYAGMVEELGREIAGGTTPGPSRSTG
ncbi:hypothetical protein [Novosphingobium soli]|uniref:Uncharacterized protein n=1 Tax=Novosphingobium soli TaxID=574956 RepID=A0ABV6CRR4_9SPHN